MELQVLFFSTLTFIYHCPQIQIGFFKINVQRSTGIISRLLSRELDISEGNSNSMLHRDTEGGSSAQQDDREAQKGWLGVWFKVKQFASASNVEMKLAPDLPLTSAPPSTHHISLISYQPQSFMLCCPPPSSQVILSCSKINGKYPWCVQWKFQWARCRFRMQVKSENAWFAINSTLTVIGAEHIVTFQVSRFVLHRLHLTAGDQPSYTSVMVVDKKRARHDGLIKGLTWEAGRSKKSSHYLRQMQNVLLLTSQIESDLPFFCHICTSHVWSSGCIDVIINDGGTQGSVSLLSLL